MNVVRSLALAIVLLPHGAVAAGPSPAREIDFSLPIYALDGKPQRECKEPGDDGKCNRTGVVAIGEVAAIALNTPERDIPIVDVIRAGSLAQKVVEAGKLALSAEDIALIKAKLAKTTLQPVWITQVVAAVDPAAKN